MNVKEKDLAKLTDMEVIGLCINVHSRYYEEIIRRYKRLVFSVVYRMVNDAEDLQDLSQEIFIKAYKNLDKYSPEFKFSTWIMRIATNHVIDFRRKKRVQQVSFDEAAYELTSNDSPEKSFLQKEESESIARVVNELPEMYKRPILLYHDKGMSYQEISDEIGEPLSKVKNRIFRGRKLLKEKIVNEGKGEFYGL